MYKIVDKTKEVYVDESNSDCSLDVKNNINDDKYISESDYSKEDINDEIIQEISEGIDNMLEGAENSIDEYYRNQIDEYLRGERFEFDLKDDIFEGMSEFKKRVLIECSKIPYGEVATYTDLAIRANSPKAQRAVGNIMNKNKYPVVIPCHRVVGKNSKLVGYAGGLELKRRLIDLEKNYKHSMKDERKKNGNK